MPTILSFSSPSELRILRPLRPDEGDKLVDRGRTILRLYQALAQGHHVYLYGVAGTGKTSLVHVALMGERQRVKSHPSLPMALRLDDLDPRQRSEVKNLRDALFKDTLVVIYEISRRGSLVQRNYRAMQARSVQEVSGQDSLPENRRAKRAIVVVDEFHRMGWFPSLVQKQICNEIGELFDRAERLQIVFCGSFPVSRSFPTSVRSILFDWSAIPNLDTEPISIRIPPIYAESRESFHSLLSRLREDEDRSSKVEQPNTLLLEPPVDVKRLVNIIRQSISGEALESHPPRVNPLDERAIEETRESLRDLPVEQIDSSNFWENLSWILQIAREFSHLIHPLVGLRLPPTQADSLLGQINRMTQIGRYSRYSDEILPVYDAVVGEEGHGVSLRMAHQVVKDRDIRPEMRFNLPLIVNTILSANNMVFFDHAERRSNVGNIVSSMFRPFLLTVLLIASHWGFVESMFPGRFVKLVDSVYEYTINHILFSELEPYIIWLTVSATYFMIATMYTKISHAQVMNDPRRHAVSPIVYWLISLTLAIVLASISDRSGREVVIMTASIYVVTSVLLFIAVPVVLTHTYIYLRRVNKIVQFPPFYAPSSLYEAVVELVRPLSFTFNRIGSTLLGIVLIGTSALFFINAFPYNVGMAIGYTWFSFLLLLFMVLCVSHYQARAHPYAYLSSFKRLLILLALLLVLPTEHPLLYVSSLLFVTIVWFMLILRKLAEALDYLSFES